MAPLRHLSKKAFVRICSFAAAALVTAAGAGVYGYYLANSYRSQLEYTYQRALDNLNDYLDGIDITLYKSMYSGTPERMGLFSAELWRDSSAAKACLSQLPIADAEIDTIYRFLSQVGEYSMELSKRSARGKKPGGEELDNLRSLIKTARLMSDSAQNVRQNLSGGAFWTNEIKHTLAEDADNQALSAAARSFSDANQSIQDYPTLIYDGPFSDHILQMEPKLLENAQEISLDKARETAARFLGRHEDELTDAGEENSKTAAYVFQCGDEQAAVTKRGGYLIYMSKPRETGKRSLNHEQAGKLASEYLEKNGLGSFHTSYYMVFEDICTINFAYLFNGTVCYTDLIKVGVALDTGEIVSVEARGYIMNHHERMSPDTKYTAEQAKASVSPLLDIESVSLALIPTSGKNEVHCYEFLCTGENGEQILVYVNTDTLIEEQILILQETPGGILTK